MASRIQEPIIIPPPIGAGCFERLPHETDWRRVDEHAADTTTDPEPEVADHVDPDATGSVDLQGGDDAGHGPG